MIASLQEFSLSSLLRCVHQKAGASTCGGALRFEDARLICDGCGASFPVVEGVPVLKPTRGQDAEDDGWFEAMYEGRDRNRELEGDYLSDERALLADLVERRGLKGPSLEIGCGVGLFADVAPGFIGLEYSLRSLFATGFGSYDRVCGDATVLPFGDGFMECVLSFNTLEHVVGVDKTFAEIDRVLRPGGFLVLKPAWHCTRYTTELIPALPYGSLTLRQKLVKALLPVLKSRAYKLATRLPRRMYRRLTARRDNPLRWRALTPYHGEAWISDADAVADIDCHEGILYFLTRGYVCHSHPTAVRQLFAGHDVVVLQKPAGSAIG